MNDFLEEINLDIALTGSKLLTYDQPQNGNFITLKLRIKDDLIVEFTFDDVLFFIFKEGTISKFCIQNAKTEQFIYAINKFYESSADSSSFKTEEILYQFVNEKFEPSIEVACITYSYKIIDN